MPAEQVLRDLLTDAEIAAKVEVKALPLLC